MFATALGLDLTTPAGLWSLAVFSTMACLIVGFLTDNILSKAGFGVAGNGIIVTFGVVLTIYLLDQRVLGMPAIDTSSGLALAAACGTALLLLMAAIKQRVD